MDSAGVEPGAVGADGGHEHRCVFGPVPSRRLGRSLGIDTVPFKMCPYDCVYCQLGPTTDKTCVRKPYVSAGRMIADLRAWLASGRDADYITLSGSGEPTLNSDIGEVIAWIKAHTSVPVAVLTNGALLSREDVRRDLRDADLLVPSLDAATDACFQRINRPSPDLRIEDILQGLVSLHREFAGEVWLEVMLVEGINDGPDELRAMGGVVCEVRPERVQVNTVVRPPAESWAQPVSPSALLEAKRVLGPSTEIIAPMDVSSLESSDDRVLPADIVQLLRRRPCTLTDMANGLGVHRNWISKHLPRLLESGQAVAEKRGDLTYYRAP